MDLKKKISGLKSKISENSDKVIAATTSAISFVAVAAAIHYKNQLEKEMAKVDPRIGFADWVDEKISDGKDHLIYTDKTNPKIVYISDSLEEKTENEA